MKYELINGFGNERFRQATGVNTDTFNKMLEELKRAYAEAHERLGRTGNYRLRICY
jgi:hypothetical protein